MTGYGSASVKVGRGRVSVDIKSVNSRFLEIKVSLPREHQGLERSLRSAIQECVDRGRIDVAVRREMPGARKLKVEVDTDLARDTVAAWKRLQKKLSIPGEVDLALLRSSGVDLFRTVEDDSDRAGEPDAIRKALAKALQAYDRDRRREGANLAKDMGARIRALKALRADCRREAAALRPALVERITSRVRQTLDGEAPDADRVAQEVAFLAERADVTEELTRLESHLGALTKLLKDKAPAGKRVEFLLQETLREFNTIGSKANHLPLTQAVLGAKGELEKLREQTANVE